MVLRFQSSHARYLIWLHSERCCYIKVVDDLLEGCQQSVILADLGYLSQELKDSLERREYHLWTPRRQNMEGASQHNNWRLLAMR